LTSQELFKNIRATFLFETAYTEITTSHHLNFIDSQCSSQKRPYVTATIFNSDHVLMMVWYGMVY